MVKPGYKQTEIGVIPEDWDCTAAKHLMKIETGSRNTEHKTDIGKYPFFVRSQNVEHIDTYHYDCEAVLTAGDGVGTGKVFHYYTGKFDAHQRVYVMSNFHGITGRYFYNYFSENFGSEVSKYTAKSSVDSVRRDMIADMIIPLPSISEQERIAEALSDVDELISSLEKLIEKYKSIKATCLQQMFPQKGETTPKMRLPGFTGAWEQRKLGDMMNVTSVKRIHQSDWTDSGVRFLRARDIVAAAKNEEPDDYLYISKEKYEEYSALSGKVGVSDLLVTGVGTIGVPYLVRNLEPLYFKDGNIIWFQNSDKIDGKFLFYSFSAEQIQGFINESAGIGTVGTYTIESGKKTPISLPNQIEQAKVGDFFQQLDNLITLHQRKLNKAKKIKQGMMQQLLTGKIRLV